MPLCFLLLAVLFSLASPSAASPFCHVVAPPDASPLVRQAALELSCYLERLTGTEIPITDRVGKESPAIVLRVSPGRAGEGKAVDSSSITHHPSPIIHHPSSPEEEEYWLEPVRSVVPPRLLIRGRTSRAVLQGAYRLLREYGLGFYFDGDAVPAEPPKEFLLPRLHGLPVFAVRGSLPWYNFFNSPTTWDEQDFRFFADQIVRSGQNVIGFHSYDFEPFAAYDYGGRLIGGEPLMTTADRVWGTYPLPVEEFGFGTARFFPGVHWGSDAARIQGSREGRIRAQKALLARGLAYASARGVRTCLGFEVGGDPTDPEEQRRFKARLTQLLRDYPMLDYVWLWQPEGLSVQGSGPPALGSQADRVYREWQEAFSDIDTPARRWEGMRVAYYGRLAQRLIDAVSPSVRLVLSGWGGDHWLHVSDYFPTWDRVLDRRICSTFPGLTPWAMLWRPCGASTALT